MDLVEITLTEARNGRKAGATVEVDEKRAERLVELGLAVLGRVSKKDLKTLDRASDEAVE